MLNDPLANTLSALLNYERASKRELLVHPASKLLRVVLNILNKEGYVGRFEEMTTARGGVLKLHLLGTINACGAVKPRFAIGVGDYERFEKRHLPASGVGILIVTTPLGVMTHDEAKQKKVGGRLLAYCY